MRVQAKGRTEVGSRKSEVGGWSSILRIPQSAVRISSGFTLVELMLVIIIIGVLAAMVVPRLTGRTEQAKISRTHADIAAIGLALDLFELDTGKYPDSLGALVSREVPSGVQEDTWNGPYLKKGLPKDPWSNEYVYDGTSKNNQDYDLSSMGPDGKVGNDDIANWD